jgi:dihydroorotase
MDTPSYPYRAAIMDHHVFYKNVRLVDPASGLDLAPSADGGLLTEDEAILDFGPDIGNKPLPDDVVVVDGGGMVLAPGLVDMRVMVGEPGLPHKETIATAAAAAAAGGVTSMICLPNGEPVLEDVAGLEYIARRARETRSVKFYAYAAATRGLKGQDLTEYGLLTKAGAVGFTDGNRAIADAGTMRRALAYAHHFGQLIIQHPEEPSLSKNGVMNSGEIATRLGLRGIPRLAEVMMIERDLRLVEMTGARYHAAHLSTREGVDAIRQGKKRGLPISCDTAPHYFALTETDVGDYRTFAKVSPPLRDEMDRRAIVEGLADGTIDAIASDHTPEDQDAKRVPFAQAAPGVIGLETLLPISLELVHRGHMTLPRLLACLSYHPARLLGLSQGRFQRGAAADLVLFDPDQPWVIDTEQLRSKSKNSAFDKRPVSGRVHRTIVDGRSVFVSG